MEKVLQPTIADLSLHQHLAKLAEQPLSGTADAFPEIAELIRATLFAYSICPELAASSGTEQQLRTALRRCLLSRSHSSDESQLWIRRTGLSELPSIWQGRCDFGRVKQVSLKVDDAIDDLFARIHRLSFARSSLSSRPLLRLLDPLGAVYSPLCVQLLAQVYDPSLPDLPDLSQHGDGDDSLGSRSLNILKSGFSRWGFGQAFGAPKRRRPSDNPTILLFVPGGITFSEVIRLQALHKAAAPSGSTLLIASTSIARSNLDILFHD